MILYTLLCGFPPFRGNTDEEVILEIQKGFVSFEEPQWKLVSVPAKDLLRKMLCVNVNRRFSAK